VNLSSTVIVPIRHFDRPQGKLHDIALLGRSEFVVLPGSVSLGDARRPQSPATCLCRSKWRIGTITVLDKFTGISAPADAVVGNSARDSSTPGRERSLLDSLPESVAALRAITALGADQYHDRTVNDNGTPTPTRKARSVRRGRSGSSRPMLEYGGNAAGEWISPPTWSDCCRHRHRLRPRLSLW